MTQIPPDVTFTDISAAQVVSQEKAYASAAAQDGLSADFTVSKQPNGLFSLTIHFSLKPVSVPAASGQAGSNTTGGSGAIGNAGAAPAINFASGGRALTQGEFDQAIIDLGGPEPQMLWALIKKESETLTGFLSDRRPVILYERHVFSRQSGHQFDQTHPDISGPPYGQGGYGSLTQQYDRLSRAMSLDRTAALKACSWGIGQTLGEGAADLGYPSVEVLVSQMIQSEGLQMHGIIAEIKQKHVVDAFRSKDYDTFARAYNGDTTGTYAKALEQDYQFFVIKGLPDLRIRAAQLYLTYFGYFVHPVDGILGDWTRQSLLKFQAQASLTASGDADLATLSELERRIFPSTAAALAA